MKTILLICAGIAILSGCQNRSDLVDKNQNAHVVIANRFLDGFYAFNADTLKSILSQAADSQPGILYYQKWAECGNYMVIQRSQCIVKNDSMVICPVTVKDDLIGALGINFNVTDTFHITIAEGKIRAVQTSSNDPDLYYEAKKWVAENRPDLVEVPCEGIWAGGATPCDCVLGMVKGFTEFKMNIGSSSK